MAATPDESSDKDKAGQPTWRGRRCEHSTPALGCVSRRRIRTTIHVHGDVVIGELVCCSACGGWWPLTHLATHPDELNSLLWRQQQAALDEFVRQGGRVLRGSRRNLALERMVELAKQQLAGAPT